MMINNLIMKEAASRNFTDSLLMRIVPTLLKPCNPELAKDHDLKLLVECVVSVHGVFKENVLFLVDK